MKSNLLSTVLGIGLMLGLTLAGHAQDAAAVPLKNLAGQNAPANGLWVETLDLSKMTEGTARRARARSIDGHPLTLGGVVYPHGIGTHAVSEFVD